MKKLILIAAAAATVLGTPKATATRLIETRALDKDYIMVHFRDGEVSYRDDGTGPSAYLGHSFAEGDDTMHVYGKRLDTAIAGDASKWSVATRGKKMRPVAASRKSKPMNTDHTLQSELDHWIFLQLPQSMQQGQTYTVEIPAGAGSDATVAEVKFDIYNNVSEAVHVNIIGYKPGADKHAADLYYWMGDGGARDYKDFAGNKVWLYNVNTGKATEAGSVQFWKHKSEAPITEANKKDNTGSDVWTADFSAAEPGRYRLVVDGVGCSMDFDISNDIYLEPYRTSLRGYYYMRLGEKPDPAISPVPRQPAFIPGDSPAGFVVYKTDLHPWSPEWQALRTDVWDEPHFKAPEQSLFYQHRLPGNPTNDIVKGGHSDAFDWDRHLAHVSNIYDLLLPYILTGGRLAEDNLMIRESGNGIPDLIDEARNEVDFFLNIRDGEAYSQGVTNPSADWSMMFQAGCTTMAAWANAANCAMIAECFRIAGNKELKGYYTDEAIKAYRFALRQDNLQLDDRQGIGDGMMRGTDFRNMAAAYLYNLTGDTAWEDEMAKTSMIENAGSDICYTRKGTQTWGVAAYLACPHPRHYSDLYENMKSAVRRQAYALHVDKTGQRPSRRATNDPRWQTSENLQLLMLAHYIATSPAEKRTLEKAMTLDADWCMGRNPGNIVEMTGLGQRHITDCYTTGRNDGTPGCHPGQTPFNGIETWSPGNGGDARILLNRCYPAWTDGWPSQESFFNQRYLWVNGEFTPRETMRGKMALLAYLHGIR